MTTTINSSERGALPAEPQAERRQPAEAVARGRGTNGLSYVAETGDGCRIYRQTNGLYAVCAAGSDSPARTAATLACAYAACQEMAGAAG